jgi:carotenoid cleavage dioxygenase
MTGVMNRRQDPYLSGVYAPVATERDDVDLAVTGELPESLVGTYLRNGPNPMFEPKGRYHVFDGDGMVHGVTLADGRASYRNRWVRTDGLAAEIRAGRAIYGGMADGDFPTPEETGGGPPMKNVANTNVLRHAGRILCLWEAGPATEIDVDLSTVGLYDFGGAYGGALTAHPKLDPVTGEMLAFGYSPFPPYLTYLIVASDGSLVRSVPIELPAPVMMHDFAITDRHAVFLDAPAVFDIAALAAGEPMLAWKPELGTRFGVVDRDGGGDVTWVETDPCYVFHFLNAWSSTDGRTVTVDGCRLPPHGHRTRHRGRGRRRRLVAAPLHDRPRCGVRPLRAARRAARRLPARRAGGGGAAAPLRLLRQLLVRRRRWWRLRLGDEGRRRVRARRDVRLRCGCRRGRGGVRARSGPGR